MKLKKIKMIEYYILSKRIVTMLYVPVNILVISGRFPVFIQYYQCSQYQKRQITHKK